MFWYREKYFINESYKDIWVIRREKKFFFKNGVGER